MDIISNIFYLIILPILILWATVTFLIIAYNINKQRKILNNSIKLIYLKDTKIKFYLLLISIGFFIYLFFVQLLDEESPIFVSIISFGLNINSARILIIQMIFMLLAAFVMCIMFFLKKSAITDEGVHTSMQFYSWLKIYKFLIDEEHNKLIISYNKKGFFSLNKLSQPLIYKKNDIAKLIFIINKNCNYFL